jgi:hypothetical protein
VREALVSRERASLTSGEHGPTLGGDAKAGPSFDDDEPAVVTKSCLACGHASSRAGDLIYAYHHDLSGETLERYKVLQRPPGGRDPHAGSYILRYRWP